MKVCQIVLGVGVVLSLATLAQAQATRTWVSGVGDDANPCSRTAPCKTFAGAISKTANGGYINAVDPGGFGAVTITKSITIDGGPFMAGVLATLGSNGININGGGIRVTLRNLDIEGNGTGNNGVNVIQAGAVHIEHCNIIDWGSFGINFAPSGSGGLLFVDNMTLRHAGAIFVGNGRATIENLRAEGNSNGVFANTLGLVTVRNSIVSGGNSGFTTGAASAVINIENSVSTNNVFGVVANAGGTIRLSNTSILSNSNTGLFNDGSSSIISLSGNTIFGNVSAGSFNGAANPKQ